jgi:putative CocE/NonD family hydrolase
VEFKTWDGIRLYADIYRPEGFEQEKLPAIISWSPYGKKYSALAMLPMCVWNCCVGKEKLSGELIIVAAAGTLGTETNDDTTGIEKFEGVDPQAWCPRRYAVISVDARGAGDSDGYMHIMGSQDAEDCYDVIEAIAELPWCNGSIGMAGNSALAIIQWLVAALQPPHLAAIAPWEGSGDIYREQFCRGGWFQMSNFDLITRGILKGKNGVEDFAEIYKRYPLSNEYWADKRADMTKIQYSYLNCRRKY